MSPSLRPEPRCPLCASPAAAAHAPFCSARCRDRDLLNWLGDAYAVPGEPAGEDDMPLDKPNAAA